MLVFRRPFASTRRWFEEEMAAFESLRRDGRQIRGTVVQRKDRIVFITTAGCGGGGHDHAACSLRSVRRLATITQLLVDSRESHRRLWTMATAVQPQWQLRQRSFACHWTSIRLSRWDTYDGRDTEPIGCCSVHVLFYFEVMLSRTLPRNNHLAISLNELVIFHCTYILTINLSMWENIVYTKNALMTVDKDITLSAAPGECDYAFETFIRKLLCSIGKQIRPIIIIS